MSEPRTFALRCECGSYHATTVVRIKNGDEWHGLDEATLEISEHVLTVHGSTLEDEGAGISLVPVSEMDGSLWLTAAQVNA